jgi:small subunit ribosomal protein S3
VGHKVHPNGFRLGIYRGWEANWFAPKKEYRKLLHEDLEMRRLILGRLRNAGIAKIETERSSNAQMTVTIHTAKPGIVIGKGGASVDQLREDLEKKFGNRVRISIQEIKQPELDAQLVAENIASQIERRISYRRAMKQSILRTMRSGARGVRVALGGRLRGSEMARREWDREGRVPLHTLRADIGFGRATARTTFGVIGVKVWIYRDLVAGPRRGAALPEELRAQPEIAPQPEAPAAAAPEAPAAAAPEAPAAAAPAPAAAEASVAAPPSAPASPPGGEETPVESGTHAEAAAVDPGTPEVAEAVVEQQVQAEESPVKAPRKRATKKAEEPKAEEPKAEEPKAEEPKAEEPKAEEPKAEEPKAEEETDAPS